MPAMTVAARSLSPERSSKPITGIASQTTATDLLSMNALPNAATTLVKACPAASPVAMAATTTTNRGFSRSAKPATTMTMPMSGSTGPVRGSPNNGRFPAPRLVHMLHVARDDDRTLQLIDCVALCTQQLDKAALADEVTGADDDQRVILALH